MAPVRGEPVRVRPFKEANEKEKLVFLFPSDAEREGFHDSEILTPAEITIKSEFEPFGSFLLQTTE